MSELLGYFLVWNLFGVVPVMPFLFEGYLGLVNPAFVYKHFKLNWFGATVVATLCGLVCPIATALYWFCKLCTVGRE